MFRPAARLLAVLMLVCGLFALGAAPLRAQVSGPLYTAEVNGTITSATVSYMRRALRQAESASATALVYTLRGQGGVLRDVRPLANEIALANVPVVVYVAPGVQAGPTGTLLLSAANIGAMGPGSSFGSPYPLTQIDQTLSEQTRDLVLDSVVDQLRGWNQTRGRNTEWIDQAVRSGALLTNDQAIALNPPAIELVAADESQLQTLLEGRTVALGSGQEITLSTLGRAPTAIEPTLWESLRQALAEPTLAFALLILGALLVYLEFATPGTAIFAGAGIVLILASLVGLFALPIQGWAMLLLLFALVLLGLEFAVPVHGALAIVGLVLMVVSGLNLIDPAQAPGTEIALWAILAIAAMLGVVVALGVLLAIRVRASPVATGQEGLIGKIGEVRQPLVPEGMIYVDGALWRAISTDGDAEAGDRVRVIAIHDLQLVVQRISV